MARVVRDQGHQARAGGLQRLGGGAHEFEILGDEDLGDADERDRRSRAEQPAAVENQQQLSPEDCAATPDRPATGERRPGVKVLSREWIASSRSWKSTAVTKAWNVSR